MKVTGIAVVSAAAISLALAFAGVDSTASEADPSPTPAVAESPTPNASPAPADGLRYIFQVLDRQGSPAPDGTLLQLFKSIPRPPPNTSQPSDAGDPLCARAIVKNGLAEVVANFSPGCPEGSRLVAVLHFPDEQFGIVAGVPVGATFCLLTLQTNGCPPPSVEWRRARADEGIRTVVIQPIPPPTAGGADETPIIKPPETGDAGLAS